MRILNVCFFMTLTFASTIVLAAPCNIGKVTSLSGNATIERYGQVFDAGTDITVCKGDKYVTDNVSVMQLTLRDSSVITVGKDSEFIVSEYKIYKDKPNLALFELSKGAFRVVTGFMTKRPHRYEVKTALATIGVRGTDFWGGFGLTENGLDVVMLSGKGVYVTSGRGTTVELDSAGLGTTVLADTAPKAPIKWGDEKVAKAVATITP
jgi:hypothetical protein